LILAGINILSPLCLEEVLPDQIVGGDVIYYPPLMNGIMSLPFSFSMLRWHPRW